LRAISNVSHASLAVDALAHQMIEIAVAWRLQFQRALTDVVERLVVNAKHLIGVLNLSANRRQSAVCAIDQQHQNLPIDEC
jgi:hypothetical protein